MNARNPRGRGGRKGQQHTASRRLKSYNVPLASPVTITRADGRTDQQPALPEKRSVPRSRRRGSAVCAMCGEKITGLLVVSKDQTVRGRQVHRACEEKSLAWVAERRARLQQAKTEEVPTERRRAKDWLIAENERLRRAQDAMR
ncbi:hypothetical protein POF50_008700 [Streptomyces sp. SL13]|uniref:Uncharacterized protein n=1 Tax=Streptantibioticus silvisoli TaxID=2705255 RepID=A0AA90H138_9ACTN|nr:hypothetical protein [Streptantibioticus silvisoli]MDI5969421.1 hypothetical protein [Streptantibioticus silvisoli]